MSEHQQQQERLERLDERIEDAEERLEEMTGEDEPRFIDRGEHGPVDDTATA